MSTTDKGIVAVMRGGEYLPVRANKPVVDVEQASKWITSRTNPRSSVFADITKYLRFASDEPLDPAQYHRVGSVAPLQFTPTIAYSQRHSDVPSTISYEHAFERRIETVKSLVARAYRELKRQGADLACIDWRVQQDTVLGTFNTQRQNILASIDLYVETYRDTRRVGTHDGNIRVGGPGSRRR